MFIGNGESYVWACISIIYIFMRASVAQMAEFWWSWLEIRGSVWLSRNGTVAMTTFWAMTVFMPAIISQASAWPGAIGAWLGWIRRHFEYVAGWFKHEMSANMRKSILWTGKISIHWGCGEFEVNSCGEVLLFYVAYRRSRKPWLLMNLKIKSDLVW